MTDIAAQLAQEIRIRPQQAQAAIDLLDSGATVPFIARYRKEVTDGLDDIQLRELEARLSYVRELIARRLVVLSSIEEQGKLSPALASAIAGAATKQELEDLYLPFKPKRRTKGQIAKEFGIEPLADALLANPDLDPLAQALVFVRSEKGEAGEDFTTTQAVLDGVRDILSERWAENAALVQRMREWLWTEGLFHSKLATGQDEKHADTAKFQDYFDYDEPIWRVPSHRALAVFRGRSLNMLDVKLVVPEDPAADNLHATSAKPHSLAEGMIAQAIGWRHSGRASDDLLRKCVSWTWRVKLSLSVERDLFTRLRESAEQVAIKVFGDNMRDLLLAAPAGSKAVMGLDPGIRTGVKVAVVDATGKLVDTATVYPHEPKRDWDGALHTLTQLSIKHKVALIAIGNGTASRETDKLAGDLIQLLAKQDGLVTPQKLVVSESGASVYSASEFASQEMPDVDVTLRGAASIARRVQDPLAELVKIDPKSIGVGQYQHDVNQNDLAKQLNTVVEDCVNAVGVDLNTASIPLLSRVSGLSSAVAKAVVRWRDSNGAFTSRQQLLEVSGLGAKTYEQSAGFLRIRGGDNPLDMTGVHPETYDVVQRIMVHANKPIEALMGKPELLKAMPIKLFVTPQFGDVTVSDIFLELEKPGRDPRPDFAVARFNDGVEDIKDLREGMELEGTVSNVAAFGAFVDIGVHQDGLVHVSQLSNRFVKDAHEVVKTGDIVKVRVVEVDALRKRISLTMKLDAPATTKRDSPRDNKFEQAPRSAQRPQQNQRSHASHSTPVAGSAMAQAFAKLQPK
ncbi:MAG: Tex family protein [Burkholderiales bacterium]|jgi:uncharacterized protein|tara:strand:- start:4385 stop:6772 length:2388 start_codon:yes stop_codon:yes gene_type:complete